MDYTTKLSLAIGALLVLGFLWMVWKFFASLLKHVLIALLLAAIGAGVYWYRLQPERNPAIGQHAYLKDNGKYLGIVEGTGEDAQRGDVWSIRLPGGYPKMYTRTRVILKEKFEAPPSPTPEPSPATAASPANSAPKKGKKGAAAGK
ncbi:MAG: hypothetical protein SF339_08240 [Blastocatellia bacterium]|nr:hypothetical protein [Blastocatellia bacterium]